MTQPVVIVSTEVDVTTDAVVLALGEMDVPYVRINTDRYPYELAVGVDVTALGVVSRVEGQLVRPRSIWHRRVRSAPAPVGIDPGIHDYCLYEAQTLLRGISLVGCRRVMSDPSAVYRAENKLAQLSAAINVGLRVPRTCISNDPEHVRAFLKGQERAICKPLRRGWFRDQSGEWSIYTTEILPEMLDELGSTSDAPAIFQELIPKACDVRVTVVGGEFFVAEIDSQSDESAAIDWRRTTNPELPHRTATLPEEVMSRLRRLLDGLQLQFAAIDLVRTLDDEYVFLEVNPNGQWLWLDDQLDLGITHAVASWLRAPVHG